MLLRSYGLGEGLKGEGNEVGHLDLAIVDRESNAGPVILTALGLQSQKHQTGLAVLTANLAVKPRTIMVCKYSHVDGDHAVHYFGSAQFAVALAVARSVERGTIKREWANSHAIIASVFVHGAAKDDKKIFDFNFDSTMLAIERAVEDMLDINSGDQGLDAVLAKMLTADHPFFKQSEHRELVDAALARYPLPEGAKA